MDSKSDRLPSFVKSITGEVASDYWSPQNIDEWTDVQKTKVCLHVWTQQQQQERSLRKMIGIWVFIIITAQVVGVFSLVTLDAWKLLTMNIGIVKFLIPSVLTEVFGMGFIVVKYLFKSSNVIPIEFLIKEK
jgi:hypothetical protein